ncbi:MAG: hypothetical protein EHM13_02750 [Acidobacteria bacterium]|nr:MAG: hypothetical protein EHM13_02750 [Acidobacteriota bacterium]
MTVRHRMFESLTKSWEDLCKEATAFASEVGKERLINISVAAGGSAWAWGKALIVVWYWE